ncbi:hypothetical protein CC80DRAFT_544541 [Byssothecium circinans]|uniref:FAD dependent oxidoreductase domain-containing protein n=1 Tax=Byssothecium circinans TaxID=147558 RepID=A0A6A5U5X5_9PLEO|nr:hypothetical protein CC80DRAFT_544541 [Byssothecium circinans]
MIGKFGTEDERKQKFGGTGLENKIVVARGENASHRLEARELCSGATGRNAGHYKPDQWRHFAKFEQAYGQEQAIKIMNNEAATWRTLVSYVEEINVDRDLWVGETLDVPLDDSVAKIAREVFERYRDLGGKVDHISVARDPTEAARRSRIKNAKACYLSQASTLQPWKLTAHVMRNNIAKSVNLQTYTVAKSVTESTSSSLIPPRAFSGSNSFKNSYGVLLPDGGLFSINPRYTADGILMFGGSNPGQKLLDQWVGAHPENCINDGLSRVKIVTEGVREFVEENFEGWKDAEFGPGEAFDYGWSGIIALSSDGVPYVGELPGKPGQWICAGHHGHGMARIFTATPGLVRLMNDEPWSATGLPEVYQMTPERLDRLQKSSKETPKVAIV